ncbi:MAG: hypothetical protein IPN46_19515 [Saprospiraceae bacterium]|nr:hypothetical protein [Saprospiraceae bacterium]
MKKLVDGVTDNWPATVPVWRFLDKNHQIINGNISPINTFINTNNLIYGNEFIGIKMGDVNGSYNPDDNNRLQPSLSSKLQTCQTKSKHMS